MNQIPRPSLERLCRIFGLLGELIPGDVGRISSAEIGGWIGVPSHTVRKDISYLDELDPSPRGYSVARLRSHIRTQLRLGEEMGVCVVGLNDLGAALLSSSHLFGEDFPVKAGFDGNINRLEILRTSVPLYPVRDIVEIVKEKDIRIAVLTGPEDWQGNALSMLLEAGIQGIVSFSSVEFPIHHHNVWFVRLDLKNELRVLSTLIALRTRQNPAGLSGKPHQE